MWSDTSFPLVALLDRGTRTHARDALRKETGLTDDTAAEEWFAWRLRDYFVRQMQARGCPGGAASCLNAIRIIEEFYPRGGLVDQDVYKEYLPALRL